MSRPDRRVSLGSTDFSVSEEDIRAVYGLNDLEPTEWHDVHENDAYIGDGGKATIQYDEVDPLGLARGRILASNPNIPIEMRKHIMSNSKLFDPKVYLQAVHPSASFGDLNRGREHLKRTLNQQSGALKLLVDSEWDRFVSLKEASLNVFKDLNRNEGGETEWDYGVQPSREALNNLSADADTMFYPIIDASSKAEKLKGTLDVFERNKFFFKLPDTLSTNMRQGRYEAALQAYKKGQLVLENERSPDTKTNEQMHRVYERLWGHVERIVAEWKVHLDKQLSDPHVSWDLAARIISVVDQLDPKRDPMGVFFQSQFAVFSQKIDSLSQTAMTKVKVNAAALADFYTDPSQWNEAIMLQDLRASAQNLVVYKGSQVYEQAVGGSLWKVVVPFISELCRFVSTHVPEFTKMIKRDTDPKRVVRLREFPRDLIKLFAQQITSFVMTVDSSLPLPPQMPSDKNAPQPQPLMVPAVSNAIAASYWLVGVVNQVSSTAHDLLQHDAASSTTLTNMMDVVYATFTAVLGHLWVRDAKRFCKLEAWEVNPQTRDATLYMKYLRAFQEAVSASASVVAGRPTVSYANDLLRGVRAKADDTPGTTQPSSASKDASLVPPSARAGPILADKVKMYFLDALYAFLDGLVHTAFTAPDWKYMNESWNSSAVATQVVNRGGLDLRRIHGVDISDLDARVLLTVANLNHLQTQLIPPMIAAFQRHLNVNMDADVETVLQATDQLDEILFEDYVKRKASHISRILHKGILGSGIDWARAPKPTEVHPFVYDALLSLVLVHAQVSATVRRLVYRTLSSLVESLASDALESFSQVPRFGLGGMLQATLEIEFLHQTLAHHINAKADATLQSIYKTISQAYDRTSSDGKPQELQQELENLKRTLVFSRQATALQFLCFRKPKDEL